MTALFNHLHAISHALRHALPRRAAEHRAAVGTAASAVLRWWHDLWIDERARYLAESTDLVDLERRMRVFDQCPRDVELPPW